MYGIILVFLGCCALWNVFGKEKNNLLWGIAFVCFILHDGLRWETGTDWIPYYEYFQICVQNGLDTFSDIGYVFINIFIRSLTNEYTFFLLFHALFLYILIFSSIKRYAIYPFLTLFLYYSMALPLLGMNRQFIAVGFCLYSLKYVVNRQGIKFLFLLLLAMLFHKSALIFAPVYFMNRKWSGKVIFLVFIVVVVIASGGIINRLPLDIFLLIGSESFEKMQIYQQRFLAEGGGATSLMFVLAVIRRIFWISVLWISDRYVKKKDSYYFVFWNTTFVACLLYILFNNTILQIFVSRGLVYLNLMEIFLIPYVLTIFKNNAGKVIILILILSYSCMNLYKGIRAYDLPGEKNDLFIPYKGIFINTEYDRVNH